MKAASDELTAVGQAARQADGERHFGAARRPAGCQMTDGLSETCPAQREQEQALTHDKARKTH